MSERYHVVKYRLSPSSDWRFAVLQGDDWNGQVPCNCPTEEDAERTAAALNAAAQRDERDELLREAAVLIDVASYESLFNKEQRRKWLAHFEALNTKEGDGG